MLITKKDASSGVLRRAVRVLEALKVERKTSQERLLTWLRLTKTREVVTQEVGSDMFTSVCESFRKWLVMFFEVEAPRC